MTNNPGQPKELSEESILEQILQELRCEVTTSFQIIDLVTGGSINLPALSCNTISVNVIGGTAEINGSLKPAGFTFQVCSPCPKTNGISTPLTVDNVAGQVCVVKSSVS